MRDLYDILGVLVQADEAAGEPDLFVLYYRAEGPTIIGHPGWPEDAQPPSNVEVDDLETQGSVRVASIDGNGRRFSVTGEGRRAWQVRAAQFRHRDGRGLI